MEQNEINGRSGNAFGAHSFGSQQPGHYQPSQYQQHQPSLMAAMGSSMMAQQHQSLPQQQNGNNCNMIAANRCPPPATDLKICIQQQQQQQLTQQRQHQPIYSPIYQSLQAATSNYHTSPCQRFAPTASQISSAPFSGRNNPSATIARQQPQQSQHMFVAANTSQELPNNLSYQQQYQPQQPYQDSYQVQPQHLQMQPIASLLQQHHQGYVKNFPLAESALQYRATNDYSDNNKPNSLLPSLFTENVSPSTSTATATSAGGGTIQDNGHCARREAGDAKRVDNSNLPCVKTNQRSKLVDSSDSSSPNVMSTATATEGKFKSCLTNLVLSSNIPFAYAIILVAFLITIIAATSIITVLTIILTITGYTAYPITESTFNTSLAIGVVCASFALGLVILSLLVWRRHCQAAYYYLDDPQSASRGTNSPQLSETFDDTEYGSVPVNEWAKHVQKLHADSDIGFSREFEKIQEASNNANLTYEHSKLPENKHKNRYLNIVAYDHTRVTLRQLGGQKKQGSDYINANFIDGYNKPRAYIGTQGPLVTTFDDYWRMIWEQRVVIIVMITNLQERGRRKCDMYWPKEGTETYGHIQVRLLQEVVMATYTLRTFTIKNLKWKKRQGGERNVYQYHYTNWPDHGVPDHPLPVLSFVRKSTSANPSGAGAIICHCSAGCGRSGTYIVIDAMLKQIRHRQSINVVDFLKHIRTQRNYLVQTEEQYIFIHDALVEAIDSGETEIASNFIAKYIQILQTGGNTGSSVSANGTAITLLSQKNSSHSITNGLQSPTPVTVGQLTVNPQQSNLSVSSPTDNNNNNYVNSQSNFLLGANGQATLNSNSKNSLANTNTSRSQSAGGQWSLLERQYRLVASFKAKDFNVVSALKPCNKNKNRTLNLIPLETHRVHITPKPGMDGSDYINATFLMGFNHLREFIVTQHPVNETFSDFWQMVYDHNSQTIVLLTQLNDLKEFPQFWPQKEDEVDYGSFKVKLTQESTLMKSDNGAQIITRNFIMRSNQDDYELQTRIIHCPGWPECCGPLSAVFDLIQVVQNTTQQQASQQRMHDGHTTTTTVTIGQEHEPQNGGPIIVVDKFGGTDAATFAVLTTLYKQINFEDAVDVYMYAKLAHLRRPGIWSSQDDYLFLYRAIGDYAANLASQSQQSSQNTTLPTLNFHHQTMTLDRHRHKSNSNSLKTSTMRRGHSQNQQQTISELSKSNNQLLLDHNQNQLINTNPISNQQSMMGIGRMNQQQHLNLNSSQMNSSPYNSAISIGTSPHQHLLANSRNNLASSQQQQIQTADHHYLYPMN